MGLSLAGKRVYADACTLIHAVEDYAVFPGLRSGLLDLIDAERLVVVTSELTLLETLVGPRKSGNVVLERQFRKLLSLSESMILRPIDAAVLERAIDLRLLGLKTPDAIHVATGMLEGCDLFLTRDRGWERADVATADPKDVA